MNKPSRLQDMYENLTMSYLPLLFEASRSSGLRYHKARRLDPSSTFTAIYQGSAFRLYLLPSKDLPSSTLQSHQHPEMIPAPTSFLSRYRKNPADKPRPLGTQPISFVPKFFKNRSRGSGTKPPATPTTTKFPWRRYTPIAF